ncbi:hypothetical protein ACM16X_04850 [Haloarcula japonica]|uniref:DUF7289 family protein n=1 Tax=Haloarcula japonica TaxID=29282 RepID=UPI0039F6A8AB
MIISTTAVVALGADAITSTQTQLDVERTEKSLTELNSKTALVALGQTDVQQVSLPASSSSTYRINEDAGWMNVSYQNTTSGNRTTVFNESMGEVAYHGSDETRLAYQGGGVWRSTSDGTSVMVSPPEFHYRDATLTLPLVTVSGSGAIRDGASISHNRTKSYFPNSTRNENFTNPLEEKRVNITVRSEYYRAWGRYFEERTDGEVTFHDSSNMVSIVLKVPAGPRKVRNAVAATSGSGSIKMSGNGAFTDSYSSGDGDGYTAIEAGNGGNLSTAGDVIITGGATLNGNITSGGRVEFSSNSMTYTGKKVEWADTFEDSKGKCNPSPPACSDEQIDSFDGPQNINSHVTTTVDGLQSSNDNAGTIAGDGVIDGTEGTTTLSAGRYHVDKIDLSNDVELDTTGGDVIIGVEDYVDIDAHTIEVSGPNEVKIYVRGANAVSKGGSDYHFFSEDGDILTTGGVSENSSQVWIYGQDHMQARVEKGSSDAKVTGVIYAPGGDAGSSRFEIRQSDFYGGVVTSEVELEQQGSVHFDQTLQQRRTIPKDTSVVAITYLHISTNDVNITSN